MTKLSLLLGGVCIVFVFGCVGERVVGKPGDGLGSAVIMAHGTNILAVDGEKFSVLNSSARVSPGEHEIVASFGPSNFQSPDANSGVRKIRFAAEAGEEYVVRGSASEARAICLWVDNEALGKRVSQGCGEILKEDW
jgi:hypothetical protein